MRCFGWLTIFLCSITITIFISSCHTTEPEKQKLELTVEDVSCTEAWIKISGTSGNEIVLKRDYKEVKRFTLNAGETVVIDDSLLPNKNYNYSAIDIKNQKTANPLQLTTLDTTSNNFTWQTFTFGGTSGSSYLNDVAIINENDIWAVGKFYMKGLSGMFNALHWNGNNWDLLKIPVRDFGNLVGTFPLTTIFAFSQKSIWFASFADLIKWDGEKFESKAFFMESASFNGKVNKIWGNSENNIYCVGNGGAIYVYNGQTWIKLESGTDLNIQDIWGVKNSITNNIEVYCVASNVFESNERKVLKIVNNNVTEISNNGLPGSISSIWLKNPYKAYLVGDGIFTSNPNDAPLQWQNITGTITTFYSFRIRGNSSNDLVISGAGEDIAHFNGVRWVDYLNNGLENFYGNLNGLDIKGNVICAAGEIATGEGVQAYIVLGKRN